jgi:presenilin enhancer 2
MEGEHVQTTADMEWRGKTDVSNVGSQWPTMDGPLGVYNEEAVKLAKSFYYGGFLLLPVLWFVNCFYFWPVLQHREAEPLIRRYVVKSGIGYMLFSVVLLAWALTFAFGGEHVFGSYWKHLAIYNIDDKYGPA